MISEVLPYLLMITCMLIQVSSKEVKWTVRDTSPKLGQDLTLFCEVDNCFVNETKRWHGGPDNKLLMLNSGISTDKSKYNTAIEKNGFILTILNLSVKDLNVSYACSCGFDLDKHIFYIEDVYKVDNLNKSRNGTNYVGTNDGSGIHLKIALLITLVIFILLFVVFIVVMKRRRSMKRLKEKFGGSRRTQSGSTDPSTKKLMSDAISNQRKVDKPAALGKAPETEATLDTLSMDLDFLSNDFELRPDLFDNILSNINTENLERVPVNTVEQENNMNKLNQVNNVNNNLVQNTTSNMMPFTCMSNITNYGQITINYNMKN